MIGQASNQLWIYKGRTNIIQLALGYDVSNDTFASEIRKEDNRESDLIATFEVSFETDGIDGELILTIDDADSELEASRGYMDVKRITGGEPIQLFDEPLEVLIKDPVTA